MTRNLSKEWVHRRLELMAVLEQKSRYFLFRNSSSNSFNVLDSKTSIIKHWRNICVVWRGWYAWGEGRGAKNIWINCDKQMSNYFSHGNNVLAAIESKKMKGEKEAGVGWVGIWHKLKPALHNGIDRKRRIKNLTRTRFELCLNFEPECSTTCMEEHPAPGPLTT